jgi:hypothetical protein
MESLRHCVALIAAFLPARNGTFGSCARYS